MLCFRLAYPCKWSSLQKIFCRSGAACCRIVLDLIDFLEDKWSDIIYFNARLYASRHSTYVDAIRNKTDGKIDGISLFIDGTKCAICRPSSVDHPQQSLEGIPSGDMASLQRVCYSGHKRRHCLNYQAITSPDGTMNAPVQLTFL